jgi:tripartite motif-containing protein 71
MRGPYTRRSFLTLCLAAPSAVAGASPWQPRCLLTWGKKGAAPGELNSPIGLAIRGDDLVHVADWHNHRVQRFDRDGKLVDVLPVSPYPGGIALDSEGRIYLSHFRGEVAPQDRMTVYDRNGKLLHEWGKTGTGPGELDLAGGVALGRDGTVYVADQTNRRVQRFTADGRFLGAWGEYGTGPGQFGGNTSRRSRTGGPQFLAVDRDGNVFTTEGTVCRVQKFTPEGRYLWSWVNASSGPGGFGGHRILPGPIGIGLDRRGSVWISSTNDRIQQFTPSGRYLRGFGKTGAAPGEFRIPHGLAFDSQGALYVVDAQNARIQKFAVK